MVDITRHPREIITPKWSSDSVVHNIFRCYEYIFGRRVGIRFEAGYIEGMHVFGTWEALLAHIEGMIRRFFTSKLPAFKVIRIPQLAFAGVNTYTQSPFRFVIVYGSGANWDTLSSSGFTNNVMTITSLAISGTNLLMLGMAYVGPGGTYTSVTYNGTAFTDDFSNGLNMHGVHLVAPATGTHNGVFTASGNNSVNGFILTYYSGAVQTGIDLTNSNSSNTQPATWSPSINTSATNCWMVAYYQGANNTPAASTNATGRILANSGGSVSSSFDSNGVITTGGFTMTITTNNAGQPGGYVATTFQQFVNAFTLTAVKGSYTLSGFAAAFIKAHNYTLSLVTGTYSLTGRAASFVGSLWTRQTKNISVETNASKSATSIWTDNTKHTSTETNQPKSS